MASIGSWLFIVSMLASNCANCEQFDGTRQQNAEVNLAACADETNLVSCRGLEAGDAYLLQGALDFANETYGQFSVELLECDGESIPVDIFRGYNITAIDLDDCNFQELPYELLSNIDSQLTSLHIETDEFNSTDANAPSVELPFSEYLSEFLLDNTNIRKIESTFLQQYSSLQSFYARHGDIESIGSELQNVDTVNGIFYHDNNISSIQSGAFRDLNNLRWANLGNNSLSTLQEDAFLGLETSPINVMFLYGNPWNCTCDLQWLKDWLNDRNLTEASGAECLHPTVGFFNDVDFC